MLHNAMGVGGDNFPEKSVTNVHGSRLLALRKGQVDVTFPGQKHCNVTVAWLLSTYTPSSDDATLTMTSSVSNMSRVFLQVIRPESEKSAL